MKEIIISSNEAGQRLDKLLGKYLRLAPKSFFYKMLRKKNITLNGKKAQGNEILSAGDSVKLFLSDDTISKFQQQEYAPVSSNSKPTGETRRPQNLDLVYEDDHIALINKPAGMLSQKADPKDVSLVEYFIEYLLESGSISKESLQLFRPSVCNRLDRNTSGLVIAGKSLAGLQTMSLLLKDRSMKKYYRCIVIGEMDRGDHLKGYLLKDKSTNQVRISSAPRTKDDKWIETEYKVLKREGGLTLLEVHLITGRSHQIRAHLASIGHPILGDGKYGNNKINQRYKKSHGVQCQMLHAYRLEMPEIEGELSYLSGKIFCAPLPKLYQRLMGKSFDSEV